ncbi:MAG: hypothetical protein Q8Q32_03365 [bacterium]|nr:hypothetical protein [bacterium]
MKEKDEIKVPAFLRKKRRGKAQILSRRKKKAKKKKPSAKKVTTKKRKPTRKRKEKLRIRKKKAVKKPAAKSKGPAKEEEPKKLAGRVTHYFDQIKVAIILLKRPIKLGQELKFEGENSFKHSLTSMQFNHQEIKSAKKGQEIGVKVKKTVKAGDIVYLN